MCHYLLLDDSTICNIPDSNTHGANVGPTWVLSAPDGPLVGPMNLAIGDHYPSGYAMKQQCDPALYSWRNGPLTGYVKLRVAHALRMPGTFSPPPTWNEPLVSDPDMHHRTCITHVPWCMSGSLTSSGGENVPRIPGACATHNFTYLTRSPWWV